MGSHGAAVASEKPTCIFLSSQTMKPIQVAIAGWELCGDRPDRYGLSRCFATSAGVIHLTLRRPRADALYQG
jgi:hypothetical protein